MEGSAINFGESFRTSVAQSRELALAHGNAFITSNHLLLAMLAANDERIGAVSSHVGFEPAELQSSIEGILDAAGAGAPIELGLVPLTDEAEGVVKQAVSEFLRRKGDEVDTGDLLLAMAAQSTSEASAVLAERGASYEMVAAALQRNGE